MKKLMSVVMFSTVVFMSTVSFAGSLCDYAENKTLDHLTGKTSFTMPTIYIALSTTAPTDAGGNVTEPVGNNYARLQTAGADWNAASSGSTSNANILTFATPSGSWGTVTHFVLYDASTSGNPIAWGALTTERTIGSGEDVKFNAGQLVITLD